MNAPISFVLPAHLNAAEPPERRGIRRDYVRLMVLDRLTGKTEHSSFHHLGNYLRSGDTLVLNSSRTLPVVLKGTLPAGLPIELRLARKKSEGIWEVLVIAEQTVLQGEVIHLSPTLTGALLQKVPDTPLWLIRFSKVGIDLYDELYRIGNPVRYEYIHVDWDLDYYQTVFATSPGSAEMPSAGRAFSWELIRKLQRQGINVVYITLHTGLSYFMDDNWEHLPSMNREEFVITESAANRINEAKQNGGRIIGVGTTVVRALETSVDPVGKVIAQHAFTNLHIDESFHLQVIDGLLTGFHEPEASHLDLLSGFISPEKLQNAYNEAVEQQYLWHEFGDVNLII
jgi:S-adenosylmethionine:tRNA ribosyltransferase-isomerase